MAKKPSSSAPRPQLDLFGAAAPLPVLSAEAAAATIPKSGAGLSLPEALRLETNLAIFAGAGAGKTYNLVTAALHALSGARGLKGAVPPSALCMLTFTEKAAGEMRERLLTRLEALAEGEADEPDLARSFESLGRPFPPAAFFRQLRDGLGAAFIGTFHSLCMSLLKQAPPGMLGSPGFELLDERAAKQLMNDLAERLVLERVEAGDAPVVGLCREKTFTKVVETLVKAWRTVREEGGAIELVAVGDAAQARKKLEDAVQVAAITADEAVRLLSEGKADAKRDEYRASAVQALEALKAFRVDRFAAAWAELDAASQKRGSVKLLKPLWHKVFDYDDNVGLDWLYGEMQIAPHEAATRGLLVELGRRVERRLGQLGGLDFTALLLQARALLRDHPDARREAQARFSVLLVDEFQDTNGVQLDLVHLLSEQRAGAPRPVTTSASSDELRRFPLEPGFLCLVGDRKQGIYEFRGADVSLMEAATQGLEKQPDAPGGRSWLRQSRRSTPALVQFANLVSTDLLGLPAEGRADFDVAFDPEHDSLEAVRGNGPLKKPVVALTREGPEEATTDERRVYDAQTIARTLAAWLADGKKRVEKKEGARPMRAGDVAILFDRFTGIQPYQQALVHAGVRHRVVRGRGFYGAQEVVDLASFLSLLSDPGDRISLGAVLRSPLVGLTDAALFQLAAAHGDALDPARVLDPSGAFDLPAEDARRVTTFRALYLRLRPERHRLKVAELLNVLFAETGFEERVAACPHGEQALGNLEKLLILAQRRDDRGAGGCAAFARELLDLADTEPNEAQGEVVEHGDAVTLCTIHQAKGLEWPVVVLADLLPKPGSNSDWLAFDRKLGLALKPFAESGMDLKSARHEQLKAIANARKAAERKRLLYVALTRASDLLVIGLLSANKKRGAEAGSFAKMLGPALENPEVQALIEALDWQDLPPPAPSELAHGSGAQARLDAAVARAERKAPIPPITLLAVTQLQDFESCPRRYHYAHQLGLAEKPREVESSEGHQAVPLDPRAQGIAAHRLLERTPLELVGTPKLRPALLALARDEALDAPPDIIDAALAFWATPFGKQVAASKPEQVFRELPFVLKLGKPGQTSLVLRGQVDLLWVDADNVAWVVDYKTTHRSPSGLDPYRFQLEAYAVAARKFVPAAREVRTGVAFLKELSPQPEWADAGSAALEAREGQMVSEAHALLVAQRDAHWEGRKIERCRALGCGYLYRCHGA